MSLSPAVSSAVAVPLPLPLLPLLLSLLLLPLPAVVLVLVLPPPLLSTAAPGVRGREAAGPVAAKAQADHRPPCGGVVVVVCACVWMRDAL